MCISPNFDTLTSPICKIFFEIRKSKDKNAFFEEPILGDFRGHLSTQLNIRIAKNDVHLTTRLNIYSDLINSEC